MFTQEQKINCPVCGTPEIEWASGSGDFKKYNCPRCGIFYMSRILEVNLKNEYHSERQRAIASSLLRESADSEIMLKTSNYQSFFEAKDIPMLEKIDRLLLLRSRQIQKEGLRTDFQLTEEVKARIWAMDEYELDEITRLGKDLCYINGRGENYRILFKGWERLAALEAPNTESTQGFVAMCFDPKISPIYVEAIRPAIEEAGYMPFRIDGHEHIGKIDDEIIRQIRRSRFVIADLTEERCNVYYEAGFAHGLGIPIFYTARKDEKLHFDIRQYNCIFWKEDELGAFKTALAARIEATLGRGKYSAGSAS